MTDSRSEARTPPLGLRLLLWHRLRPRSAFMRRLAMLTASTAAGQIVLVLVSPLLTRLYAPEDFGFLASFTSILGILGMIACLRYDLAIPLCRDEAEARAAVGVAILGAFATALATALPVALFGGALAGLLGLPASAPLLWWLPPGMFLIGLVTALNAWAMQRQALRELAWSKVALSSGQAAAQTGLGLTIGGPQGIVSGYALGYVAAAWVQLRRNREALTGLLAAARPRALLAVAGRYRRFPLLSSWGALLNSANRLLPALLLAVLYGPQIAGFYALAQRIVGIPIRFVAISASQVYISESARLAGRDHDALHAAFVQTTLRLCAIGAVYLGGVALVGPWLFELVFGDGWAPAGDMVRLLFPMYLAMFVKIPIEYTLNLFERQDLALLMDLLGGAVVLASFGGGLLGLEAMKVVALYSVGMSLAFGLHVVVAYGLLRRHGGRGA
jgi:O-antigen/teichoic acid export membrane protein